MRAPFCSEATDLCPDDRDIIGSESENENEIHAIERTLERSRINKTAVFGISLNDLMGTTPKVVPQIPFILSRLCSFIEIHGMREKSLFSEGEEKRIVESLRTEFTECGDAPLESTGHVASVAKLLVIFFEELPEPLIPVSSQPDFIQDMEKLSLNSSDCFSSLKMSLEKLPDSTYQVLKYLSRFLLRVTFHKEHNGLTSDNLALIFGPLIFRPSSNDRKMIIVFQNIMNHFVKDYHALFESSKKLQNEVVHPPVSSSKRQPCPSSVMPVMSLSPLSVVIPTAEDNVIVEDKNTNVPILLIDGHLNTNSKNINDSWSYKEKCSKDGIVNIGIVMTRKRKERRFSGEDVQQRSSSEERPSPNSFIDIDTLDIIRRCNSHEEVMESETQSLGKTLILKKRNDSQFVDSYATNGIKIHETNLSPHPPNAKRREVEINRELDLDLSWSPTIMLEESTIPQPDSQNNQMQNSIAETSNPNSMDCDNLDEEEIPEENYQQSWTSDIPRSASCPVPNTDTKNSADSESNNLSLSWSMLFEDSEPVRAEPHLYLSKESGEEETLLSPSVQSLRKSNYYEAPLSPSAFRSYLSYRSTHLDPSVPPSPPVEQEDFAKKMGESSSVSDSIKHLTKKIHGIKKRIRKYDEKFEAEFGFKPSHAEKYNNYEAKKMMNDLYKARKELKALKEEAHLDHVSSASWHAARFSHILGDSTNHLPHEINKDKPKTSVEDLFDSTLRTLADDRKSSNRPDTVDDMTKEQVQDEKIAIQRALLNLEKIQGKPITKEQRNTCRPLYDRYRSVKKLLVRSGSFPGGAAKNKELCSELQPILEHVTMDFPLRHQKADLEKQMEEKESEIEDLNVEKVNLEEKIAVKNEQKDTCSSFLATKYDNSNLHELPLSEMIFQMQKVKAEKRNLRKVLKEFETEFLKLHGRKAQKEDRASLDSCYNEYKHVKARLRLLEALISKHDQHQLM